MECYWDPTRSVSYYAIPLEEHHHDLAAMLVLYIGELLKRCASLNRLEIKRNKEKTRNKSVLNIYAGAAYCSRFDQNVHTM